MIAMLAVRDIRRSVQFYTDALQFQVVSDPDRINDWNWAVLRAPGGIEIMLAGTENGPQLKQDEEDFTAIYYFYPEDVRDLHADLQNKSYPVTPLHSTFYGMLEFGLRDPDGHLLAFGQEVDANSAD